jgi:uncharacterized protein YndB with AHSA1/START domain
MAVHHSSALTVTLPSDREIVLSRVFDAPRALIFEALSKPEHISQWWGPRGASLGVVEMDFRPGGAWRFVSRDADGNEAGFRGEYREIVPPERVVQTFEFDGMPGHISLETLSLQELDGAHGGRTKMTVTSVFDSVDDRDGMLHSGMEQGASETYDRLAEFVRKLA